MRLMYSKSGIPVECRKARDRSDPHGFFGSGAVHSLGAAQLSVDRAGRAGTGMARYCDRDPDQAAGESDLRVSTFTPSLTETIPIAFVERAPIPLAV